MNNCGLIEFQVQAKILLLHLHNIRGCAFALLHEIKKKKRNPLILRTVGLIKKVYHDWIPNGSIQRQV